ncbi:serine acetyltransferase [Pseudomonas cichorii]|uniref:serine O-acetyltransferase n=1 Tax=Pseudomonas serbiensis TaxID=3064350 RepID=A0ABT9CR34_9PSED|nr:MULTISPECIES: serine O-acetyltransferase [Pseudomonas]MDO7927961.1 serine O-acetyltransferase [Pseudomonas sp. KFB-138]GFM87896.1 serine acetyltransferase [Pseudomonas cichorii]
MEPDKRLTLFHNENSSYRQQLSRLASIALQLSELELSDTDSHAITSSVIERANQDLIAQCTRDPASRFKPLECHLSMHSAFFAVLCYRVAHSLISAVNAPMAHVVAAMKLGFVARSMTGIDIHPEARLGERFVIDHGYGTVIGQTVEIGDDAYLLNGIILGGRSIGDAPDGKRHPTIGHRVQIAANAKILGPVHIGDDVIIGSDVTITEDVPAQQHVYIRRERLNIKSRTEAVLGVGRA